MTTPTANPFPFLARAAAEGGWLEERFVKTGDGTGQRQCRLASPGITTDWFADVRELERAVYLHLYRHLDTEIEEA